MHAHTHTHTYRYDVLLFKVHFSFYHTHANTHKKIEKNYLQSEINIYIKKNIERERKITLTKNSVD